MATWRRSGRARCARWCSAVETAAGLAADYEPRRVCIPALDVTAKPDEAWARDALGRLVRESA